MLSAFMQRADKARRISFTYSRTQIQYVSKYIRSSQRRNEYFRCQTNYIVYSGWHYIHVNIIILRYIMYFYFKYKLLLTFLKE